MKWKSVSLENVCQHRNRTFEFGSGVNGVLGSMGSGKSNLVYAMNFLLTGTWPGAGTNEEQVAWGADKAVVTGELQVNGIDVTIKRSLHTSSCSLKVGTQELIRKAIDVNKTIAELVGVSPKVLDNYCFVHQGLTNEALFDRPAERAKMFNILFGTDDCEQRRDLLSKELQTHVPVTLTADQENIHTRVAELESQIAELHRQLEVVAPIAATPNDLRARYEAIKQDYNRFNDRNSGFNATTEWLAKHEQGLVAKEAEHNSLVSLLNQLSDRYEKLQGQAHAATNAVKQKAQADSVERQRVSLQLQLNTLEEEFVKYPEPAVEPDQDDSWEQAAAMITQREHGLRQAEDFVRGFSHGECPSCHTTLIVNRNGEQLDIPLEIDKRKQTIVKESPDIKHHRTQYNEYVQRRRNSIAAHDRWKIWFDGFEKRLTQTQNSIDALPAPVVVDTSDAQTVLAELDQLKQQKQAMENNFRTVQADLSTLRTIVASGRDQLVKLQALPFIELTDIQALENELKVVDEAVAEFNKLQGQLSVMEKSLTELRRQQTTLLEIKARSNAVVHYRTLCSQAAGILHRDNFPAAVAKVYFNQLNAGWNRTLATLNVPFTVEIMSDTSVRVHFPVNDMRLEKLSGGQKCCASLSFLLEVNRSFAPQAGFIVLDEPTYGIDKDHIECLLELLTQIQTFALSVGLQVFIVTHEERLEAGFSHLIRI